MDVDEEAKLRKQKLNELKKNIIDDSGIFYRDPVTSAPSIRHVDEFQMQLSIAEKRKREAERQLLSLPASQRFASQIAKKKKEDEDDDDDWHNNVLVTESQSRSQERMKKRSPDSKTQEATSFEQKLEDISDQEFDLDDVIDDIVEKRSKVTSTRREEDSKTKTPRVFNISDDDEGGVTRNSRVILVGEQQDAKDRAKLLASSTDSGSDVNFVNGVSHPISHTTRIVSQGLGHDDRDVTDPLSQSLQDWRRAAIREPPLGSSLNGAESSVWLQSKPQSSVRPKDKTQFRDFLASSFGKKVTSGAPAEESLPATARWSKTGPKPNPTSVSSSLIWEKELRQPKDVGISQQVRSCSPDTVSVMTTVTEFGDPDKHGKAKRRATTSFSAQKTPSSRLKTKSPGLMATLSAFFNGTATNKPPQSASGSAIHSYDEDDDAECSQGCRPSRKKSRRSLPSCGMIMLLLAIDLFTIVLVLALFSRIYEWSGPNIQHGCSCQNVESLAGAISQPQRDPQGSLTGLESKFPHNGRSISQDKNDQNDQNSTNKIDQTPKQEFPSGNDPKIQIGYEILSKEIEGIRNELQALRKSTAFACQKREPHALEGGIVTYSTCHVITDGINPGTGVFTVKKSGLYQLSFTGLMNILNGHQLNADIVTRKGNFETETVLIRSSGDTNEVATFLIEGTDDDMLVSVSMSTLAHLQASDEVFVRTELAEKHGRSLFTSFSTTPTIHFSGFRISD